MSASVPTLRQADASVGEQPSERLVAHDEVRNRLAFGLSFPVRGCKPDEMDESVLVDNDFDVSKKQCALHSSLPLMRCPQWEHHHGRNQSEMFDCVICTEFVRRGFQAVSLLVATNLAAVVDKTAKCLFGHRNPGLDAGFVSAIADGRQISPKQKPNNIFLDDLDVEARHEKTGQRLRFSQFRRVAMAIGLHFLQSLKNSISRATSQAPRDRRRPCAGMVALSPLHRGLVGHRSSLSGSLLSSPHSVAGNGDSNVQVQSRGIMLQRNGARFREPARAAHA